jgi:protein-disulfide isomerase
LRLVFRNFPLSEMHPAAEAAAEVAEFAGAQGKFWEMHDKLYENQERLGETLYLDLAEKLKLSTTALRQALEERTFEARVRSDFKGGVRSGVNGTPTSKNKSRPRPKRITPGGRSIARCARGASPGRCR